MQPKEHIEKIQRDFEATQRVKKSLNNSIKILAEDLYSKETHFVFELIQNAEDNTYKNTDEPSVVFRLSKDDPTKTPGSQGALIIENNEIGFNRKNIDAICAIGETTKKKVEGYIGEKGIGFKSVFKITSSPHIFSNGYSFKLPENDKESGLGYIVPRWVSNIPESIDISETTIILPLDKERYGYERIAGFLREIEPETILFLSTLKELQIEIGNDYSVFIMKDDSQSPLQQLIFEEKKGENINSRLNEYLVVAKRFDKPNNLFAEKRESIDNREVTIALPLTDGCTADGKIFAYLPVHGDSGLPFLINADFLLTSSREGIKENEPWNLWLRDCIHEVFIDTFKKGLDLNESIEKMYSFIPLESSSSFLEPIVEPIQNSLKIRNVVLTEPDNKKCLPWKTRTSSKNFRSLLTNGYPKGLLEYPRIVITSAENYKKQIFAIGVTKLSFEEIKECLKDKDWISQHDYDWLVKCYRYLLSLKLTKGKLSDCPIVPVKKDIRDKKVVFSCVEKQPIYFECDEETKKVLVNVPKSLQVPLAFVDEKFLEIIGVEDQLRTWMTDILDVYPFSKGNYTIGVLNWLNDHYQELSENDIVNVTHFLVDFMDNDFDFSKIPILLEDGRRMLLSEAKEMESIQAIVTPEKLDPDTGWQNIWFKDEETNHLAILSNRYNFEKHDEEILKGLWEKLGITDCPLPYRNTTDEYGNMTAYEKLYSKKVYSTRYKRITNYHPPQKLMRFGDLTEIEKCAFNRSIIFWLRQQDDDHLDLYGMYRRDPFKWTKMEIDYFYRTSHTQYLDSELTYLLKNTEWLLTTKGFVRPNQTFRRSDQIKEILGDSVPYFEGYLPDKILQFLGVRTEATAKELLNVLSEYSKNNKGDIKIAERVYKYLSSLDLDDEIINRLQNDPIIYIVSDDKSKWVTSKDVIWSDQSDVLGHDFIYLESHYPKLRNFFVDIIKVKEDADKEVFARQWLELQNDSSLEPKRVENSLTVIYKELLSFFKNSNVKPKWWDNFIKDAKIWTQNKAFKSPGTVFVPDDAELKKVFKKTNISFAWRPEKDSFTQWDALYRTLKLKYLSEFVKISISEESNKVISISPSFLTIAAKVLIVTWLFNKHESAYQRILNSGLLESLLETKETMVRDLKVNYKLNFKKIEIERDSYWDDEGKLLLFREPINDTHLKNSIAQNIARVLLPNRAYKDFADWIELVIGEQGWKFRREQRDFRVPDIIEEWLKNISNEITLEAKSAVAHPEEGQVEQQKEGIPKETSIDSDLEDPKHKNETASLKRNNKIRSKLESSEIQEKIIPIQETEKSNKDFSEQTISEIVEENNGYESESFQQSEKAPSIFEYSKEFRKAFAKPGPTSKRYTVVDNGNVKDPERRRDKSYENLHEQLINEPKAEERRRKTVRTILEGPDIQVREYLNQLYNGKCQICGETFTERTGDPFFVVKYIVPRKIARIAGNLGNALCFCAEHFAKWEHGTIETDIDIIEQIKSFKTEAEGGIKKPVLKIKLCDEKCEIVFKEKHFLELQTLLEL